RRVRRRAWISSPRRSHAAPPRAGSTRRRRETGAADDRARAPDACDRAARAGRDGRDGGGARKRASRRSSSGNLESRWLRSRYEPLDAQSLESRRVQQVIDQRARIEDAHGEEFADAGDGGLPVALYEAVEHDDRRPARADHAVVAAMAQPRVAQKGEPKIERPRRVAAARAVLLHRLHRMV